MNTKITNSKQEIKPIISSKKFFGSSGPTTNPMGPTSDTTNQQPVPSGYTPCC